MDGSAVHAVIGIDADLGLDDLAANYHRVDGEAVHPTVRRTLVRATY